jgi:hypothetical protein
MLGSTERRGITQVKRLGCPRSVRFYHRCRSYCLLATLHPRCIAYSLHPRPRRLPFPGGRCFCRSKAAMRQFAQPGCGGAPVSVHQYFVWQQNATHLSPTHKTQLGKLARSPAHPQRAINRALPRRGRSSPCTQQRGRMRSHDGTSCARNGTATSVPSARPGWHRRPDVLVLRRVHDFLELPLDVVDVYQYQFKFCCAHRARLSCRVLIRACGGSRHPRAPR